MSLCFVIFWGTFLPLISEALTGHTASVRPPWFGRYVTPLALVLVLLSGLGPVMTWRRTTPAGLPPEKAAAPFVNNATGAAQDGLGRDYNGDGKGNGFTIPSLLGIYNVPPYYHNGACETLECVVGDAKHRTALGTLPDRLGNASDRAKVVAFLRSIH